MENVFSVASFSQIKAYVEIEVLSPRCFMIMTDHTLKRCRSGSKLVNWFVQSKMTDEKALYDFRWILRPVILCH